MNIDTYCICRRCHQVVESVDQIGASVHITRYDSPISIGESAIGALGFWALCEDCFTKLTPEERLPYYRKAYKDTLNAIRRRELKTVMPDGTFKDLTESDMPAFEDLQQAVLEGK